MIKNIVFDIGNVLFNFNPKEYIKELHIKEELQDTLYDIIFNNINWLECDRGTYTISEYCNMLQQEHPNLAQEIEKILHKNWVTIHKAKNDTIQFLEELASKHFHIYLFSNCSKEAYEYIKQYPFFKYVEGGIYSFELHSCKPEDTIYECLLEKYNLNPFETIFIDDNSNNIQKALEFNIHGIVFDTLETVKEKVYNLI